jgi:hypothetical protein
MNSREHMIVDLQHRGDPKMFITERVDDVEIEKGLYKFFSSDFPQFHIHTYIANYI